MSSFTGDYLDDDDISHNHIDETKEDILNTGFNNLNTAAESSFSLIDDDNNHNIPLWKTQKGRQYSELYLLMRAFKDDFNVKINVPMFCFIGFQSSGKTSSVSQAAQMALGIMQNGTASRQPVRFTLKNNPNQKTKIIKINGKLLKNEKELINELHKHGMKLDKRKEFTDKILEVEIESYDVPQLTFVDLPGLLSSDKNEQESDRIILDKMTANFINSKDINGYDYLPILVRPAREIESDDDSEIKYINSIVEKYGGNNCRKDWLNDALFIVNKFDTIDNMNEASRFIESINHLCTHGKDRTVITVLNPHGKHKTSRFDDTKMQEMVKSVVVDEQMYWNKLFYDLMGYDKDTDKIEELKKLVDQKCKVNNMNKLLGNKMIEIVKKTKESMDNKLHETQECIENEIDNFDEQLRFCDPNELKTKMNEFVSDFLSTLRRYYKGEYLDEKIFPCETWEQENKNFKQKNYPDTGTKKQKAIEWFNKHKLCIEELEQICGNIDNEFITKLKDPSRGSTQIRRQLEVWKTFVAHIKFPHFEDYQIRNMGDHVSDIAQGNPWMNLKNMNLKVVDTLREAGEWLAERSRHQLLSNADHGFEYTFKRMFKHQTNKENLNRFKTLIDTKIMVNYRKQLNSCVNKFRKKAEIIPRNLAEILDKHFIDIFINVGKFAEQQKLRYKHSSKKNINNNSNIKVSIKNPLIDFDINNINEEETKNNIELEFENTDDEQEIETISESGGDNYKKNDKNDKNENNNDKNDNIIDKNNKQKKNKDKNLLKKYNLDAFDTEYYKKVYLGLEKEEIKLKPTMKSIREVAKIHWICLKSLIIQNIETKFLNLIISKVRQHDATFPIALLCGVDECQIMETLRILSKQTKISVNKYKQFIEQNNDAIKLDNNTIDKFSNEDIIKVYGIDQKSLQLKKDDKKKELDQFKKRKAQWENKISKFNYLDD